MNQRHILSILSALSVCLFAINASGQQVQTFDVEQFEPLPAQGTNNLNLAKSEVLRAWRPSFGLFTHYVNDPLTLSIEGGDEQGAIVGDQLKAELWASIGLFDFGDIGLVMPLVVWQDGDDVAGNTGVEGFAPGDLRVIPKVRLIEPGLVGGLGVGVLATVWLPTGDTDSYNSDGSVRVEPRLIVDYELGDWILLTNVAVQIREAANQRNFTSGNTLRWGAGVEAPTPLDDLKVLANLFGAVGFEDARDTDAFSDAVSSQSTPVEADLALQYALPLNLVAQAGAGLGLTSSVGSPDFRVFASIGYTPRVVDSDGDGLLDEDDDCPDEPEDKDGFEDSDGCPDLDNDDDGVVDVDDACPLEPEDKDGFEDADGCPDPDNDGDGIVDVDDACPDVAGIPEKDGCPLTDDDGDGLIEDDQCPQKAEDKDGFQDDDGCPDLDNDKDGILDINDSCPDEPEVINGFEDEDGCPDEGESKVKVTDKKIEILEKVYFDTNKATIKDRSFNVLQQVASVLKNNKQITKIRVEGHTDSRGRDQYNLELSQERANSVRDFLVQAGVPAERLEAVGYGETSPIDNNETSDGRERNRRVEFLIVEIDGKPMKDVDPAEAGVKDTSE